MYRTVCYGKDVFLNHSMYLFGSAKSPLSPIEEGAQSFSFESNLPPYIPSTVNFNSPDVIGKIEYSIRLSWDTDSIEKCFLAPFYVKRIENLNWLPELKPPVLTILKTTSCFGTSPAYLKIKTPSSGFALGETISVYAEYASSGSSFIKELTCSLFQVCDLNAFHGKDQVENRFAKISLKGECGNRAFKGNIRIPLIFEVSNSHCSTIVQFSYELRFEAQLSGCRSSLHCSIPIFIGSVGFS